MRKNWVWSWGWKDSLEKVWPPPPVFLPGEFHGGRGLVGYSPWGHRVGYGCKLYDVWWLYLLAGAVLTKYHKPGSFKTGICFLTVLEARNPRSWCGQGWFLLRAERESAPSSFLWFDALLESLGFLGFCCITQSLPLSQSGVLVCVYVQIPAFYNNTSHNRLGVYSTLVWLHVNCICNTLISKKV